MPEIAMLRTPQAAEYLGLAPATLAKWRVVGGGPRDHKLGRTVVYDPVDLRAWLDLNSRRTTSECAGRGPAVPNVQTSEPRTARRSFRTDRTPNRS